MKLRIKFSTLLIEQKEERVALYLHGEVCQRGSTLIQSHTSRLPNWYGHRSSRTQRSVRHKFEQLLWVPNVGKLLDNPQGVHTGGDRKDEASAEREEGKTDSPLGGPKSLNDFFRESGGGRSDRLGSIVFFSWVRRQGKVGLFVCKAPGGCSAVTVELKEGKVG